MKASAQPQWRIPACHDPRSNASRSFATAGYLPGHAAAFEPVVMPRSCVHASMGDAACVLAVHHRRERKTGPQIAVTVLQCRTHRRAFTLYPLGHVPYGRLAVAPVGLEGQVVRSTEPEPEAEVGDTLPPAWRATLFASAFAAIHEPMVKLTDSRWWATDGPDQLRSTRQNRPAFAREN